MPKTVVIGAGISGLVAASCLAKAGHEVSVLEKNNMIGGRARAFDADGFFFDMGPSWYWMPDVFEHFFNQFGKSVSDYYQLVKLDPGFRIFFKDSHPLDIPASGSKLNELFESIEPGSSKKLSFFLKDAAYKYHEGMLKLAFKPSLSVSEYMDPALLLKMLRLKMFKSASKHIRASFKDPRLIALMEFPLLFLGAMPSNIPSLYTLMNYAALEQGTWYPMGGMFKIVEAMKQLADSLGVRIFTDHPVHELIIEKNMVSEVYAGQEFFAVDNVVASGDYAYMEQLLDPAYRNYDNNYWKKRTFAPSCLIFYLGVKKKIPGLQHHNLFFDADFSEHASQIYKEPSWPADPLFYVCCPSKTDGSVAPENCENLFVLMPVATHLNDEPATKEYYYDLLMSRIEKHCGISIKQDVVYKRIYSGTDFQSDYHAYGGNAYGLANTLRQTAILKPRIENRKIKNLIYTGQLTVPGPGVPPCIISGQIAADLVTKKNLNTLQ